jgi:protein involved in polysaccharide export with SLBB domain
MQTKIKAFILILLLSNLLVFLSFKSSSFAEITSNDINEPVPTLKQSITVIRNEGRILSTRYLIQPGDVFSFSVYDEANFTQPEIIVRPDGYATIEPVGEVYVAGYDIQTLTGIIAEKLSLFVRSPQISINIREFHPAIVYVYGAVQKPGMFQQVTQTSGKGAVDSKNPIVKTDLNISNVIANAGGITEDADLEHVEITSEIGEKKTVNLWKLLSEGDTSQNLLLRSGDKVYIPKLTSFAQKDEDFKTLANSSIFPETFPVRVIGEVVKAGLYEIPSKSPYLNSAIAIASGYTIDANKKAVLILRKTPKGVVSKIYVNPENVDLVLRPNDIISVNTKCYVGSVRQADYLNRFIAPIFAIPNSYNSWAEVFIPNRRWKNR